MGVAATWPELSEWTLSVCRGSYDGYVKHKRNNPTCDHWNSQGNEKLQFVVLLLLALTF